MQAAAAFWYEIKTPVQPQPDASSVEDEFSSSERSSECSSDIESEKLSDEGDSDDEPGVEDEDSSSDFSEPYPRIDDDAVSAGGEKTEENGEKKEENGDKVEKRDLYTAVEIAGRSMRSSKRRRAQKRDIVRAEKKAKRSKIQIVKGAPLPEKYKRAENEVEDEDDEEDEEEEIQKVHAELKANIDAKAVRRAGRPIDESYKRSAPIANHNYNVGSAQGLSNSQRRPGVQTYHKDDSGRYIRLLKRTAGSGKGESQPQSSVAKRTAPQEPTLKVPFLEKNRKEVPTVSSASAADKKTKTETFTFTIDAKIWEALKDKPDERQQLIMEHVQKMRNVQKESPQKGQKVQNSRHAPWFSSKSSQGSQPANSGSQSLSQEPRGLSSVTQMSSGTVQPQVIGIPQNNPYTNVAATGSGMLSPTKVIGSTLQANQQYQNTLSQVTKAGQPYKDMPTLPPIGAQVDQRHQMAKTIPTLTPAEGMSSQVNVAQCAAGVSGQSLVSSTQLHVLQQPQVLQQATAISSAGYSVSTLIPKEQVYILLPNGQLTKNDGTAVKTRHFAQPCKSTSATSDSRQLQFSPLPTTCSYSSPASKQAPNLVYIQPQNVQQHLQPGCAPSVTVAGATSRASHRVQETAARPMYGCATEYPTAATNFSNIGQQVHSSGMQSTLQQGQPYHLVKTFLHAPNVIITKN